METLDHSLTFRKRLMETVQGIPASNELEDQIIHTLEMTIQKMQQASAQVKKPSKQEVDAAWAAVRQSNPFKEIKDPVGWQREIRRDRDLPNR